MEKLFAFADTFNHTTILLAILLTLAILVGQPLSAGILGVLTGISLSPKVPGMVKALSKDWT